MGLLRDVLARFAVNVDIGPLSIMDRKINKLKGEIKDFAQIAGAGFAAAAAGAYMFVDAASKAEEQLNVITVAFGKESVAGIDRWAKETGAAMSRSEYDLIDSVGRFGAFLQPTFEGTNEDIQAMSKSLSELAVDLASVYNTSDSEAMMRLFSGMSGETEAVRRLGINISDEALTELNLRKGGKGKATDLSLQEKTMLRYEKILMDTEKKQGDAINTADGWANSVRALQGQWRTFSVTLGKFIMGPAKKLLQWTSELLETFNTLVFKTSALETVMYMLGARAAWAAGKWAIYIYQMRSAIQWTTVLNTATAILAGKLLIIIGLFLALEDAMTFLDGGDSAIGRMISEITGIEAPIDRITRAWQRTEAAILNAWEATKLVGSLGAYTMKTHEADYDVAERERDTKGGAALVARDKEAFVAAMRGSELSDTSIDKLWEDASKEGIASGKIQASPDDLASGYITGYRMAEGAANPMAMPVAGQFGAPGSTANPIVIEPIQIELTGDIQKLSDAGFEVKIANLHRTTAAELSEEGQGQ